MEQLTLGILMSSNDSANLESRVLASSVIQNLIQNKDYSYVMGASGNGIMRMAQELFAENNINPEIVGLANSVDLEKSISTYKVEVESVFERTKRIYEDSDALLFLSGGIGTFSELYAMLDANMEMPPSKPIFIYNADHSYDYFLADFNQKIKNGFADEDTLVNCYIANSEEELLTQLTQYEKTEESKVVR